MIALRLSNIIGQSITDLRYHYSAENEYGLQSFYAYLKLSDDFIIDIPRFNDEDFLHMTE